MYCLLQSVLFSICVQFIGYRDRGNCITWDTYKCLIIRYAVVQQPVMAIINICVKVLGRYKQSSSYMLPVAKFICIHKIVMIIIGFSAGYVPHVLRRENQIRHRGCCLQMLPAVGMIRAKRKKGCEQQMPGELLGSAISYFQNGILASPSKTYCKNKMELNRELAWYSFGRSPPI